MNVIFTAHTRTREQGEGDEDVQLITGPNLSPATQSHLLGAVGLIGYMHKREVVVKRKEGGKVKRKKVSRVRLLIGPSDRFETGVRYSAFKDMDYIDSPNFTKMLEKIKEGGITDG
jgi:hypothetical protein